MIGTRTSVVFAGALAALLLAACGSSTPQPAADAVPDAVLDVVPETGPDTVPDGAPDGAPDMVPDGAPDMVPDGAPDTPPDTAFDTAPDIDTAPDAGQQGLAVLFLGNSYTFYNDLPGQVADLAGAAGIDPPLETDSATQGGALLSDHWANQATMEKIETGGWTHVVLQGQSYVPVAVPFEFTSAAGGLSNEIHAAGAIPVFFETWAREEGHPMYQQQLAGYTPATMQAALREVYQNVAQDNEGLYAPVGDAWEVSLAANPDIDLFASDGSHPSKAGSYLAALVFHGVLNQTSPESLPLWPESLTADEAAALQSVAAEAVGL